MSWFELRGSLRPRTRGSRASRASGRPAGGTRQWRAPLLGAAGAAGALTVLTVVAFKVSRVTHLDAEALDGFWHLQRSSMLRTEHAITNSVNAVPFISIAAAFLGVALHTRQRRLIVPMAILLVGANLGTQLLKSALPGRHFEVSGYPIATVPSFPSGHATAAMSLVLCAVILTPCRGRAMVTWLGAVYALAVGYSVLVLTNHFASDVIAGYLMAVTWALLGLAAMPLMNRRKAAQPRPHRGQHSDEYFRPLASVLAIACAGGVLASASTAQTSSPATVLVAIVVVAVVGVGAIAAVAGQSV